MTDWIPLLVAAPLAAGALLTALHRFVGAAAADAVAGLTAAGVAAGAACLALAAREGPVVVWIGGWEPREGTAIGIALAADVFGAGFACLIALLVLAVLVHARLFFARLDGLFQALLMIFLGAATGYCLTGDLFNLYVFFELAGVTAFVLTAFRMEEDALHGAMTFAVINSLASIVLLLGIGVLYAEAGSVSLHELGLVLADGAGEDAALRLAFVLVMAGFLIKSAVVPFHFWLADAYAGAAAPVCVLFGGASVTLGIFGAARVLWTVFGLEALPPGTAQALFWPLGLVTALYAATMALVEPNLKRVLALTTVSHVGVLLVALGAENEAALAGGAAYLVGHAFVKAALFVCAGLVVRQAGHPDLGTLAPGGGVRAGAILLALGGLMLAGLPGSAIHEGKAAITGALGDAWGGALGHVLTAASVLAGAALVHAALRIARAAPAAPAPRARPGRGFIVLAVLLGAGAVVASAPSILAEIDRGARHFVRTADVAASVLAGARFAPSPGVAIGGGSGPADFLPPAAAVALALALLHLRGVPAALRRPVEGLLALARRLHALHTGHVGDYVAWSVAGLCGLGLAMALLGAAR